MTTAILALLLSAALHACTPAVDDLAPPAVTPSPTSVPAASTPRSTSTLVQIPAATTPAPGPTQDVPTPFPTSLEAFGMHYDPAATLEIPPWGSVSMLFWGSQLPVQPYLDTPAFITYSTPQPPPGSGDLLAQAGCQVVDIWGTAECSPDSPLQRFDCTFIVDPGVVGWGLEPDASLVAECQVLTEEHEAAKAGGVHLVGCAFKRTVHYIFKVGDEYTLVSSQDELRQLLVPIDTPAEALSYAQMVTGLDAVAAFSYDPTLMYFHAFIPGTRLDQVGRTFEVCLFHRQGCGCEPWFTTRITLRVDPAGQVTWQDAIPLFMTTGWSCAD
jgi:hypothetical protein